MTMKVQHRWMLIGSALLLTLGAMYMVQDPVDESTSEVMTSQQAMPASLVAHYKSEPKVNRSLPDLSHKAIYAVRGSEKSPDLFKTHAWYVPPPPKPVVVKLEKPIPTAPPVPFFYLGKLENTPQGTLIFLSLRNKVVTVIAGQEIDKVWRLDKENANALTLTYLPLGMTKVLSKMTRSAAPSQKNLTDNTDADNQNAPL